MMEQLVMHIICITDKNKKIEDYIWFLKRRHYLKTRLNRATTRLSYYDHIKVTTPFNSRVGEMDMVHASIPRFNPRKEVSRLFSTAPLSRQIRITVPLELEKLRRWHRINNRTNIG